MVPLRLSVDGGARRRLAVLIGCGIEPGRTRMKPVPISASGSCLTQVARTRHPPTVAGASAPARRWVHTAFTRELDTAL